MGKVHKKKIADLETATEGTNKLLKKTENLAPSITNIKKIKKGLSNIKSEQTSFKKKFISNVIKNEHQFISSLFEILDLSKLNQGRRNDSDEEENSDSMQVADIPEQKVFKKQTQKKGSSQSILKNKSFPNTIEGLQKELAELKGAPNSYQKTLRKKGLQSRLQKKKRKEQAKLRKAALTSAKKQSHSLNGLSKTKPILNSDGNVVSNKFDFADTDMKKENKKKQGAINNEVSHSANLSNGHIKASEMSKENNKIHVKTDSKNKNIGLKNSPMKKENNTLHNTDTVPNNDGTPKSINKPIFNKENKMVFSRVYMPESHNKQTKKESRNKNPKKILEKLKEENKKISEIEKEDKDKALILKEKQKWATALKRASGEKVKDDPELLRKSIAREKNKKVRSQKKWKARMDNVEKDKEGRQKKRKENLQARKNEKKKKKMKKAIKKGSYVPL